VILVVLQEGSCWRTLSTLWKYGGDGTGHITDIAVGSETGEETVEGRRTTDLPVVRQ